MTLQLKRPKVYVVQEPMRWDETEKKLVSMFNFNKAAVYGDIEVCLHSGPVSLSPIPLVHQLRDKLRGFTDQDYLIPAGDPSAIAIAVAIASDINRGKFNLLKYDKATKNYIMVQVNIFNRSMD